MGARPHRLQSLHHRYFLEETSRVVDRNVERDVKIVDVYVCKLRKKLGEDGIENVWGKGYRLSDAVAAGFKAELAAEAALAAA